MPYENITSEDLFKAFSAGVQDLGLPESYNDNATWTVLIRRILRRIGQPLGYQIRDQDLRKEFLSLDQAWRIQEYQRVATYLAMESENTTKLSKVIDEEFEKLIDVRPTSRS